MEENDSSGDGEVDTTEKRKDEQFEAVINLVRQYKFIYDFEDNDHKDRDKVNKAWNDMGKELGQTGKWVHQKWKYLREYYRGLKTGRKGRSGQQRGTKFTWPHYESLKFLDGVRYSNDNTVSNMDFDQPRAKKRNSSSLADGGTSGHDWEQHAKDLPSPTSSSSSIQSTRVEVEANATPKSSSLPIFASVSAVFYILGLTAIGPSSVNSSDLRSIQPNFRIPFVDVRDASDEAIVAALTGIFAVALVSCILVIAFSTFLLLNLQRTGTSRNVKVWLGYKAVMIVLAAGYILTVTISGYSTVAGTISDLVSLAMHLYFFWIVWSYWKQLLDEKALSMTPNITQIQGNIEVSFPL